MKLFWDYLDMSCRLLYNNSAYTFTLVVLEVTSWILMIFIFLFQIPATIDDVEGKKDPVLEGKELL